ncbi:MAG: cytochrome C [Desulfuromonadales bacterium]|nr:cytochrome C [Desulfuromonadales bacterium]
MKRVLFLFSLMVLGVAAAAAVTFDHSAHLGYVDDGACASCHLAGAKSIVPDNKVCLDCHDQDFMKGVKMPGLKTHGPVWALNHRPYAKMNDFDCAACHQQVDCLKCHASRPADEFGQWGNNMINVHRSDFHITHPLAARTDQKLCASCHEARFCSDCHNDFRLGRASGPSHQRTFGLRAASDFHGGTPVGRCDDCHTETVAPNFHEWTLAHAREARKNLATCQSCHPGGDTCLKCHTSGGFNPHGKSWGDRAGRLQDASKSKSCKKCHTSIR